MDELKECIYLFLSPSGRNMPFFAHLLLQMKKEIGTAIPTAGVRVSSIGIELYINPDFFRKLTVTERLDILEHECLHLVNCHQARTKGKAVNTFEHMDWNIAADCAINQYINGLNGTKLSNGMEPITISNFKKHYDNEAKSRMHMEYYHDLMKKSGKAPSQIVTVIDDHSLWENSDLTKEQIESKIKSQIRVARDSCKGSSTGSSDLDSMIKDVLGSDINWKTQLRQFISNSAETLIESTRKRRNRRYGIIHPGHKHTPKLNLAVCLDTSGSISDAEGALFFAELNRIIDGTDVKVTVIEADSKVQNVYEYEKNKVVSFKGRGGTAYQPALTKAEELKVDGILYFGDGDTADIPKKPKIPLAWVLVRNSEPPVKWGRVINLVEDPK